MSFSSPIQIANYLINSCVLLINGKIARIAEIEMYFHSEDHPDPYVDRNPIQATSGNFYFAKGGTFKRVDFCFGNGYYLSFLLRSLIVDNQIIEGPCRCLDFILKAYGLEKYSAFPKPLSFINNDYQLVLREKAPNMAVNNYSENIIFQGPRIGLKEGSEYRHRPYRFALAVVKKEKSKLFTAGKII